MKISILEEPELEFAHGSRHIDPRFGLAYYGPADVTGEVARSIRVGIVGNQAAIDGIVQWLERCRKPIAAKDSPLVRLFPEFPGFNPDVAFRSTLVFDGRLQRSLPERELRKLKGLSPDAAARAAVELYSAELEVLHEEARCDVVLCARPDNLPLHPPVSKEDSDADREPPLHTNFHDLLKARAMRFQFPLQLMRRETWDHGYKPPRVQAGEIRLSLQDEATRAWNLHTAMYYKAGGVPWRLPRDTSDLTTCFIGISFYRTAKRFLRTSVAQVFNERGDGVIVRGAPAVVSKEDHQPHLTRKDGQQLLATALGRYRAEHHNSPARVVIHKTSSYNDAERQGFWTAAEGAYLARLELLWLSHREPIRLLRPSQNPPLRGTFLSLDEERQSLYTRGSIPFYGCYPGLYVPHPLSMRLVEVESSPAQLASEILVLTKMNWNQTQLDGRPPITLRTADTVGDILRHVEEGDAVAARYAYYM